MPCNNYFLFFYHFCNASMHNRQCCGPCRNFDMKIFDNSQQEVIHLERPLRCASCWTPCCLQEVKYFFDYNSFYFMPCLLSMYGTRLFHLFTLVIFFFDFFRRWLYFRHLEHRLVTSNRNGTPYIPSLIYLTLTSNAYWRSKVQFVHATCAETSILMWAVFLIVKFS